MSPDSALRAGSMGWPVRHAFSDFFPIPHLVLDPDGTIVGVNLAGAKLLGFKKKVLVKERLTHFTDDQSVLHEHLRTLGNRLTIQSCEIKIGDRAGTRFHAMLRSTPVQDHLGRYLGCHTAIIDLSSQKEREERYRIVADYTYDWEYWIGPGGELIYISPSCERITGYTKEEFLADESLMGKIIHPGDRSLVDRHRKDDYESSTASEIEYRILHRDGMIRWISHACQPVYDEHGAFLGRRSSNRDITARIKTEEALHAQQNLMKAFCDTSPDAIFIQDRDSRILLTNPAFCRILGVTTEEVMGKNAMEFHSDADVGARFIENDQRIMKSGIPEILEECLPSPEGDRVYLTSKAPYWDASGKIIGIIAIGRDITDRKNAEEGLKKAHDELELRVWERTNELTSTNKRLREDIRERKRIEGVLKKLEGELKRRSNELNEMNTALRTLLEQRGRDKRDLEMRVLANVNDLIMPCLEKLKKARISGNAKSHLAVLESNLNEIVSPFASHHTNRLLSPMEMQVANYIREGLRSKEIGELLGLSKVTVDFYRNNIRKKLGLRNTKTGLRSYLLSLAT
jgi:PAS domain S-box-containing protein